MPPLRIDLHFENLWELHQTMHLRDPCASLTAPELAGTVHISRHLVNLSEDLQCEKSWEIVPVKLHRFLLVRPPPDENEALILRIQSESQCNFPNCSIFNIEKHKVSQSMLVSSGKPLHVTSPCRLWSAKADMRCFSFVAQRLARPGHI